MPVINLAIRGKEAIGDNTKIVCMNSDYVVQITFEDCNTLINSPIKKLVVKDGWDYKEASIDTVEVDGQDVLQSKLPVVERPTFIELGVVGRNDDDPKMEPNYTSTPAKFECIKSALSGAVVLKSEPKLGSLAVAENGLYKAVDKGVSGFYEVDVLIPSKVEESRIVEISMESGNQVVTPLVTNHTMSQVTIMKPANLTPDNIRKDIGIGGVIGTYAPSLAEKTITANGDYVARTDNVDGYNVVKVDVPVPDGYITPEGTKGITTNGTHDVKSYENVSVLVQPALQEKTVTENGDVTPDSGYDGLSKVTVNITAETPNYQDKTVTENGTYTADTGYDALSSVTVEVPGPTLQEKVVTGNGEVTPDSGYDGLSKVVVAITGDVPEYQSKSVTPTTTAQTVVPDTGYDALSSVTVAAIETEEVTVTENGEVTPTYGKLLSKVTVNVTASDPTTEEQTVTPSAIQQVVTPIGADYLSSVTVEPIPDEYIIPSGELNIIENGTYDVTDYESVEVDVSAPDGYVIPSGEVTITTNGEHDVSGKATAIVNVPSVIEITEFPLTNIDTNAIYSKDGKLYRYKTDLIGTTWSISNWSATNGFGTFDVDGTFDGAAMNTLYVGYAPHSNDGGNTFYFQAAENTICINTNRTKTSGQSFVISFTGGDDIAKAELISWITEYGTLTGGGIEWVEYIFPDGSLTITENGTHTVTDKKTVNVNVTKPNEISTVSEMNALLASAPVGSIYKYTGESGTYESGAYYVVESE